MKEVYLDLLKKGVHFPPSDPESETAEEVGGLFFDLGRGSWCMTWAFSH